MTEPLRTSSTAADAAVAAQLAQLRGEGPVVSDTLLSPPGAARGNPIGRVEAVNGEVVVSGVDQSNRALKPGDPIFQGDIVATRGGGGAQIEFGDGTIGHLGADARMLVQEFGTGIGSSAPVVFMIGGPFSFASPPGGAIAANALTVRTPVASVRLEGGRLVGRAAPEAVENKFTLLRNFDGTIGRAVIATASASFVLDGEFASAQVVSLFRAPSELPSPTLAQVQADLGGSVFDWIGATPAAGGSELAGPAVVGDAGATGPIAAADFSPGNDGFGNDLSSLPGGGLDGLAFRPDFVGGPAGPGGRFGGGRRNRDGDLFGEPGPVTETTINVTVDDKFGSGAGAGDPIDLVVDGGATFDTFNLTVNQTASNTVTISEVNGRVVLSDTINQISLDGIEELTINLGSGDDDLTINNLTETDIAESTVRLNLAGGNDTADATNANRRHVIRGGDGDDTITGSAKLDDLFGDAGDDTIKGLGGNDRIEGGDGDDTLEGGSGNDRIDGGAGNDTIDGGTGRDTMTGGSGDDTFTVDDDKDTVSESLGGGTDTVNSSVTFELGDNIENLTLTGSSDIDGTGNALANTINGNSGNNTIDGGTGADTMTGGSGNDTFTVDNAGDTVNESAGGGTDTVNSSITFTLGANVENLTLTGSSNINGTGNGSANTITGNSGNNALSGGDGNDTYVVQNSGDTVTENAAEGTDTVQSSVTFTLGANIENLTLTGSSDIDGTGNTENNTITGNSGDNVLTGLGGDDTYVVQDTGDTVVEGAGGGTDTVQSSVTFTLSDNVENLTLTGSSNRDGTGNALNNTITGNSGNNDLAGLGGDDTYVVQNTGDTVTEAAAAGTDTVQSSVNFTLSDNVENLTLTGSSNRTGTGNALDNTITGNSGNNTLAGLGGSDTINGEGGTDTVTYAASASGVTINLGTSSASGGDAAGDTLSNIENITGSNHVDDLTGDATANTLSGLDGNDTLNGGDGNDTLIGGDGGDTLNGGDGTDTISYAGSNMAVTIDLSATGTDVASGGDAAGDTISSIENVTGSDKNDTLTGDAGANTLNGGSGNDDMTGLGGNDVYVVDSSGDSVTEAAAGGIDTVQSSITYTLGSHVENLILTGSSNINGTGNTENNTITGNSGNNSLSGGDGTDTLSGGSGTDTLTGGAGNDTLTGGSGADTHVFGAGFGDDTITDFVVGTDKIDLTAVSPGSFADLLATTADSGGNAVITLSGNTITLTGVTESQLSSSDFVGLSSTTNGSAGDDTINGTSEADTINAGNGKDTINGLGGNDTINGENGQDTIAGGAGADNLTGGTGNDDFYYGATSEGGDTVTDFNTGNDDFVFLQSAFGNLNVGTLDASNFSTIAASYDGSNGTSTAATGGTAGFIFSTADNRLTYDADGNVGADGFTIATLSSGSVAASDVEITATSPV